VIDSGTWDNGKQFNESVKMFADKIRKSADSEVTRMLGGDFKLIQGIDVQDDIYVHV
jgi:hypothetical protein